MRRDDESPLGDGNPASDSAYRRLRAVRESALRLAIAGRYQEAGDALRGSLADAAARRAVVGSSERERTLLACTYYQRAGNETLAAELRLWLRRGEELGQTRSAPADPKASGASRRTADSQTVLRDEGGAGPASAERPTAPGESTSTDLGRDIDPPSSTREMAERFERDSATALELAVSSNEEGGANAEMAQILAQRGDWEEAARRYLRAGMAFEAAKCHLRSGDAERCVAQLRGLLIEEPSHVEALALLNELAARPNASTSRSTDPTEGAGPQGGACPFTRGSSDTTAASAVMHAFEPDSVIADRYRLVRLIGRGGMSLVYRAADLELEEDVALKVFTQPVGGMVPAKEHLQRFRVELKLNRMLRHVNIIRMHDIGIHAGHRYLTMELLRGRDLGEVLEGVVPQRRALQILVQIAAGLQAAHDQGVVHRDVKPANVFVTEDDTVKLMDFGIAKSELTSGMTIQGTFAGTPVYMSPEQVRAFSDVGPAADQYSLGVVAFHLLTGQPPFEDDNVMTLLMMQATAPAPSLRSLKSDIPEDLETIVLRMLEKEPADRWPSCGAVAERLREILVAR